MNKFVLTKMIAALDGGGSSKPAPKPRSKRPKPLIGDEAGPTTQGRASGLYGLPKGPKRTRGVPDPQKMKRDPWKSAVLPGGRGQWSEEQQMSKLMRSAPLNLSPAEKMRWLFKEIDKDEREGRRNLRRSA